MEGPPVSGPAGGAIGGGAHEHPLRAVSVRLAAVTDPEQVAQLVLGEARELVGADTGSFCLLEVDGDALEIVADHGYPSDVMGAWTTFPVDAPLPASEAARTGEPVFIESDEDRDRRFPALREGPLIGSRSHACLPLITPDGTTVGVLVLGFATARPFHLDEVRLLNDLADHAAVAIARTTGRVQLAFIAEASARLAQSLDLDETVREVGRLAVPQLSDRCAVYLVDGEGRVALSPADRALDDEGERLVAAFPVDLDAPGGVGYTLRTGEPVYAPDVTDADLEAGDLDPTQLDVLRDVGFGAALVLPLRARSRVIGALALTNARGRAMTRTHRLLAEELAARAAVAIDNAMLFQSQQISRRKVQDLVSALQRTLLPPALPGIPGSELAARYLPGMAGLDVGGDFYDVFDTGGEWAMVIGDVCGKGPEAAALTAVARSTLRSVAMEVRHPSQVMRKLNEALLHQDLNERFCTVAYARVLPIAHGMRVVVCRGGHTAPLIRRADGRIEPVGAPGPLIGVFPELRVWEETAVIEAGDALVLYTDGVTEARSEGEQFGDARLLHALADCDSSTADSIATAIEKAVLDFCGQPTDDTAILVLRIDG